MSEDLDDCREPAKPFWGLWKIVPGKWDSKYKSVLGIRNNREARSARAKVWAS